MVKELSEKAREDLFGEKNHDEGKIRVNLLTLMGQMMEALEEEEKRNEGFTIELLTKTPEHIASDAHIDALKAAWSAESRHLKSVIKCFYDEIGGLKEEAQEKSSEIIGLEKVLSEHTKVIADLREEIEWRKKQLQEAIENASSLIKQNRNLTERCNFLRELLDGIDGVLKMLPPNPKRLQLLSAIRSVITKLDRRNEGQGPVAGKQKKR